MFNIVKETDTHQNRYSKFEVRPKTGGGLYDTYRFLIRSEIDRQYNMCFIFSYNMQKKRFAENVKQFSGIDCVFIGDENDDSPPLVILQEDMKTILISEMRTKDEIGLPRGDLKLDAQIKALYSTPFRKGLAIIYICQNKIKFSRNKHEDNELDDFKILDGTREYFRLSYDEDVFNIVWQSAKPDPNDIHGALITNKRICIIDNQLKELKSLKLGSGFSYNFVYSSYWLGQTLLYTTQNHIYYTNIDGESQIIFTFNSPRSVICDVLADRITTATYDDKDNIIITTRKVHMLEPLLMGYLSYAKTDDQIDLKLFKCALEKLDTEQISRKLIDKLMQRKLYNSAWFLLQSPHCPQFTVSEKYECLVKLHKPKDLFEVVFGAHKDIINSRTDLSEAITKITKLGDKGLEHKILKQLHSDFSMDAKYDFALKCAEVNGDHRQAIESLFLLNQINSEAKDGIEKLQSKLGADFSKDSIKMMEIINFGKNLEVNSKVKQKVMSFKDDSRTPWDLEYPFNTNFDSEFDSENPTWASQTQAFDSDISSLNRLELGFDAKAFSYQVRVTKNDNEKEPVPSVMNDNMEHWLGFGSLDTEHTNAEQSTDMMGEDTNNTVDDFEESLDAEETYDNIEDTKYLIVLWRFDQGAGSRIIDLSENKNNGNILKDGIMISNEDAGQYWEDGELAPGEPLDFEDEWGKQSPPNWAMTFTGNESLRTRGSKNLSKLKGHFTFQVWLKMSEFSEFTLFKRQAEDFNVKLKELNMVQISREHSIRNILTFDLSEDIKLNEWVHISIIYRQLQQNEEVNDNCGLKILLNSNVVFSDSKLNFRKPMIETDGLIFLDGYKGQFTELRFWNINLSKTIIQDTYKKPLDCVNDLRKRVQIDDDQFSMMNIQKKKARGKRATLVAPTGKTFGFGGGLMRPPRSSVKISQQDINTLKEEAAAEEKDKSDGAISEKTESDKSDIDQTEKEVSEKDDEPTTPKDDEDDEMSEQTPKDKTPKEDDDFAFDFQPKRAVEEKEPTDSFWGDDGFGEQPKAQEKSKEKFDDFDWDSESKPKAPTPSDDFGWDDEDAQQVKKNIQPKQDDGWEFDNSDKDKTQDIEESKEAEDQQNNVSNDEPVNVSNEEPIDSHQDEQVEHPEEPEEPITLKEPSDHSDEQQSHHSDTQDVEYDNREANEIDYNEDTHQDESDRNIEVPRAQDFDDYDIQKQDHNDFDDREDSQNQEEIINKDEDLNQRSISPKKKDSFDDFEFSKPVKSPRKEPDFDDFDFDKPNSKPKDSDFDFDFVEPKKTAEKPKTSQNDDFDFDFGGPTKTAVSKNDEFAFDDFGTPSTSKPKEEEKVDVKREPEEAKVASISNIEQPVLKSQSSEETVSKTRKFSNASRKLSIEPHEFNEEINTFMEECVQVIQEDIKIGDYENALNNIEANMNELIYDLKELERNKETEDEESYKQMLKELKANIRFLTFYKLSMKVCIQVREYTDSQDQQAQEKSASLANILVLPPVHEEVKKIFYKMAIDENLKCKNYKVALKLIKSYDKQIKNPSENELNDINKTRDICEELQDEGKERFQSVD